MYSKHKYLKLKDQKAKFKSKLTKRQKKYEKKLQNHHHQSIKLSIEQISNRNPTETLLRRAMQKANINYEYQKPYYNIDRYVCVDFYLPDFNIVVELDGSSHKDRADYDLQRTMYLKRRHNVKKVIRFTNKQAVFNMEKIINTLKQL